MKELLVLEIAHKLKHPSPIPLAKEIVEFSKGDKNQINKILKRISKNEPWEYIRGYTDFLGNKIFVDKHTLIPRIETEELVKIAIKEIKKLENKNIQIIDIGTGSGCIAISINKALKKPIIATDISGKALKTALTNAKTNNCLQIRFENANLLNFHLENKDTVILANLPYIRTKDIQKLDSSVKDHEPVLALDGGSNGIDLYIKLLEEIKSKEINFKLGVFEIADNLVKPLKEVLEGYKYKNIFLKDQFDNSRFLVLKNF